MHYYTKIFNAFYQCDCSSTVSYLDYYRPTKVVICITVGLPRYSMLFTNEIALPS